MKIILRVLCAGLCIVLLTCLGTLLFLVIREDQAMKQPLAEDHDAIIVLGAQVREDGSLSLQLQWRLDAAFEAWQKHPAPIVVCGAQGSNEPEAEASAMRRYLMSRGVPDEQILMDDKSFNTRDNIRHAAALLKDTGASRVLIVTSDYHLPRAMALAADEGLDAAGLGAATKPEYWLKNHARETLAWIKYWLTKYTPLTL